MSQQEELQKVMPAAMPRKPRGCDPKLPAVDEIIQNKYKVFLVLPIIMTYLPLYYTFCIEATIIVDKSV